MIPQHKAYTLLDVLDIYPIFNTLCAHLEIASIIALKKTTKQWSSHLSAHLTQRWNINRRLRRFVDDPRGFRSQLARHQALISGSFVLQFLDGVFWEESDLDVFIQDGPGAVILGGYLERTERYRLVQTAQVDTDGYNLSDVVRVQSYLRMHSTKAETKIQIISCGANPAISILDGFHTTAVVNMISWNKVYSVFPDVTFLAPRTTFPLKEYDERCLVHAAKYADRGWVSMAARPQDEKCTLPRSMTPDIPRRIGDSSTWTIPLDTSGVEPSTIPDSTIECCEFNLLLTNYTCLGARTFEACVLQYPYSCAMEYASTWSTWWDFLVKKTDALTLLELQKMKLDERPNFCVGPDAPQSHLYVYNNLFEKPATWMFWDDEVPKWRAEWEKSRA